MHIYWPKSLFYGMCNTVLQKCGYTTSGINSKKARMAALSQHIPDLVVANLFTILGKEGSSELMGSTLRPLIKVAES